MKCLSSSQCLLEHDAFCLRSTACVFIDNDLLFFFGKTYQIDMCFIEIIEHRQNVLEIRQDFIMPCHIRRQNGPYHAFSNLFEVFTGERFENIAILVF